MAQDEGSQEDDTQGREAARAAGLEPEEPLAIYEYEQAAHRTISDECQHDLDKCLLNAVLGLVGEAGEVADHIKKHLFHGHTLDFSHVEKELGDILWYVAEACYAIATPMAEVAEGNIQKLLKRYPDGFSSERSLSRLDMVEVDISSIEHDVSGTITGRVPVGKPPRTFASKAEERRYKQQTARCTECGTIFAQHDKLRRDHVFSAPEPEVEI